MGKACRGWEAWQVQRTGVRGAYLIAIGQACNDRFLGRLDVGDMRTSGEKIARCAGSKMAHLLMVAMSMLTVRRSVAAARAYGWVGVGRVDNIFCEQIILLLSAAPPCQKLLYHSWLGGACCGI